MTPDDLCAGLVMVTFMRLHGSRLGRMTRYAFVFLLDWVGMGWYSHA